MEGRSIGQYQVLAKLGAGGMGEVHLATDTRLNRPVAIKAIAPSRLRDPGAVARLRAEALTAASLDHPYICKIYELLEEGDELFIVMEFIEGETLAEMLRRGMLPVVDTVRIAAEIAEGLENAHARGLVHRDIKPSNVIVTPHGHVKLLDFGIAGSDVTSSPGSDTRTASQERHGGHGPGTPEYMAPEQAMGSPVTARADLFSLGVVIYQCLTGRLPFDGMTSFDYVRHMLSDAPRPLHRLAAQTPDDLVHLVERCLEKTPAHRPESAAEMRALLRQVAADLDPASGAPRAPVGRRVRRRRLVVVATTLVVLAGAAVGAWLLLSRPESAPAVVRQLRRFSTAPGEEWGSRFSPDGQWVSFIAARSGGRQLFLQRIAGGQPQPVTLPPGLIEGHVWSPDGLTLACLMWTAAGDHLVVHIVDAFFGGVSRRTLSILDFDVRSGSPAAAPPAVSLLRWINPSTIYLQIATRRAADLHRLDLTSGTHAVVKGPWAALGVIETFDVHPDGKQVAFSTTTDGQTDLWTSSMAEGEPRRLTNDVFFDRSPLWGAGGSTIVFQSNRAGQVDLWEISQATGVITQITSSADVEQPEDTYRDGSALYQLVGEKTTLELIDLTTGRQDQLAQEGLSDFSPTVSANGQVLAFQRSTPAPLEGSLPMDSRLFFARFGASESSLRPQEIGESGFAPRLSPDGKWVAYLQRAAAGEPGPTRLRLTELETNRTLGVTTSSAMPALSVFPVSWSDQVVAWSASSDAVYFVEAAGGHQVRRFVIGSTGAEPLLPAPTGDRTTDLHLSPDGRSLGALARTDDRYRLRRIDVQSGQADIVHEFARTQRARYLGWTQDGAGHVLAESVTVNDDSTREVDVLVIGATGRRLVGRIPSAVLDTMRLVPGAAVLYLTRVENEIDNIYSYSLLTGALRRITSNTLVDVTFAAVEPVRPDRILTVRDERKQDIWLLDAGRPSAPAPAKGR